MWKIIENEILPFVDKPGRYVGDETNSAIKDHSGRTSVTLIYPDIYEVGISNIGLKILYDILNSYDEFVCERAYSLWTDMEQKLREKKIPLYSLETKKPLGEFDILGFTFQYELLYTNFLNILDLSGIPLYTEDRDSSHPFIFGGGPVSSNLEPVAPFLDAICVGDGESRIVAMTNAVRKGKLEGLSRQQVLQELAKIDGVYVPSFYQESEKGGFIIPAGKPVRRYSECDLNSINFVTRQILPNIQAVQDRAVVEAARGCTRGCRFCQAGMTYRPVRERSIGKILDITRKAVKATGYREFSLISLSISDYTQLNSLIDSLDKQFSPHGISFSLPSLRLDSFTLELAQKVREIRKSGLTFAVEGGTQFIRDSINKGVVEEELLKVVKIAKDLGWKSVKLYFMIGLPNMGEQNEVDGIAELIRKVSASAHGMTITVSVAIFIPKPHTPFQWDGQYPPEKGMEEFRRLIDLFRRDKRVNIRYNNPFLSYIEGVFSRGDRKLARAIESAFRKGARFDGWNDRIDLNLWAEAFAESGIHPETYLQPRNESSVLPWSVIDTGASEEFLFSERQKAKEGQLSPDCREACHYNCGNCDFDTISPKLSEAENVGIDDKFLDQVKMGSEPKYLVRFLHTKLGNLKFVGPIDFEEILSRALVRANMPLAFTKGFNPHIRIESSWALPTGFASGQEVSEMELAGKIDPGEFIQKMNETLPEGVKILACRIFELPHAHLTRTGKEQFITFSVNCASEESVIRRKLENASQFLKITPKREMTIDLREFVRGLEFSKNKLTVTYLQKESGARIQDVIQALFDLDVRHAVTLEPTVQRRFVIKDGIEIELMNV